VFISAKDSCQVFVVYGKGLVICVLGRECMYVPGKPGSWIEIDGLAAIRCRYITTWSST
jgi:hypothetical protein